MKPDVASCENRKRKTFPQLNSKSDHWELVQIAIFFFQFQVYKFHFFPRFSSGVSKFANALDSFTPTLLLNCSSYVFYSSSLRERSLYGCWMYLSFAYDSVYVCSEHLCIVRCSLVHGTRHSIAIWFNLGQCGWWMVKNLIWMKKKLLLRSQQQIL